MTIYRVQHKKDYTVVNNFICKDNRLSWKAKGIWLYAFSRPDDWVFNLTDLIRQSTDGRESVTSGLKELEESGYLHRDQKRSNGQFSNAEWVFYETPEELKKSVPQTENPSSANQGTGNQPLLSTEKQPSTEKQQQQGAAAAVFSEKTSEKTKVYPVLDAVDIPIHDKEEITRDYTEQDVAHAVEYSLQPGRIIKTCLAATIKWACKIKPALTQSKEDIEKSNKSYAKKYDGKRSGLCEVVACNKYVEIVTSVASNPYVFGYHEAGFMEKFKDALTKCKFTILEE